MKYDVYKLELYHRNTFQILCQSESNSIQALISVDSIFSYFEPFLLLRLTGFFLFPSWWVRTRTFFNGLIIDMKPMTYLEPDVGEWFFNVFILKIKLSLEKLSSLFSIFEITSILISRIVKQEVMMLSAQKFSCKVANIKYPIRWSSMSCAFFIPNKDI